MESWIDRVTSPLAPRWTLQRKRARISLELLSRHYEAASKGRRTQGWVRSGSDVNAVIRQSLSALRDASRDTVRNNAYAESALTAIADHTVGWGITGAPNVMAGSPAQRKKAAELWKAWAESKACDADGRHDLYGLQNQVMRTVAEAGEVLIRRRIRRPDDNLPIPLQLQIIEPDFLDASKDQPGGQGGQAGRRQIQGVEFDAIGRRVGYWLFKEHPGSSGATASDRIPAEEILHVYRTLRPGQVRGVPWFAPVLLRMKDFDDFEDATLMKQKIAACLAVITTDLDGSAPPLGPLTSQGASPDTIDYLEPGVITNVPPGRQITVVQPPTTNEHDAYSKTILRAIATGLGLTYEDLTGDYADMPFSAARMSRLRHWARVDEWRWQMLIPQFCDPVWRWAMQAAAIIDLEALNDLPAVWTAPPMPMIEPDKEGLAYQRNIRTGILTLSEALRERGYDPVDVLGEMAEDWKRVDALGLILDADPRRMTQAGQAQTVQPSIADKVNALAALVGAGFDPEESLGVVGLPAIAHTGTLPATDAPPEPPESDESADDDDEDEAKERAAPQINVNVNVDKGAVESNVTLKMEPGAVQMTAPPVTVEAGTTIQEGAIKVETPVTVTPASTPQVSS